MTAFPGSLLGEFGSRGGSGSQYVGFDLHGAGHMKHVTAIIGNLGFVLNLRTGIVHMRIMSSLKERKCL